jgi:hypothetical protein
VDMLDSSSINCGNTTQSKQHRKLLMSKEGFHTMIAIDWLVTKVARAYSVWSGSTFSLGH